MGSDVSYGESYKFGVFSLLLLKGRRNTIAIQIYQVCLKTEYEEKEGTQDLEGSVSHFWKMELPI